MNPVIVNCVLLYIAVVIISLVQSRFKLITDSPVTFILLLLLTPLMVAGKARHMDTWMELTGLEIFVYTLVMASFNAGRIVPKINEGYVYAYTLFHWYLLADTVLLTGWNFWLIVVAIISVYPTFIMLRAAVQHKIVSTTEKIILLYWFLFTVCFTFIDQVALQVITPVVALYEVNITNSLVIIISALQLYFVATMCSLLLLAIPIFHLPRDSSPLKQRWKEALKDHREILNHKLDNYIDYQISLIEVALITIISGALFLIDATTDFRIYLVIVYTLISPLLFFYFKWSPDKNIEDEK